MQVAGGMIIESQLRGRCRNGRQMSHTDFAMDVFALHRGSQVELRHKPTFPWTMLLMLSDCGYLYVTLSIGAVCKIFVKQGCFVLFRGDVLHAGAAFQERHVRAHWYLVPIVSPYQGIVHADVWRHNDDGEVALHSEDPSKEWSIEASRREPRGVVLFEPPVYSLEDVLPDGCANHLLNQSQARNTVTDQVQD